MILYSYKTIENNGSSKPLSIFLLMSLFRKFVFDPLYLSFSISVQTVYLFYIRPSSAYIRIYEKVYAVVT